MSAAFASCNCVDFVDDHCACCAEHSPPAHARQHDVERLGRRDENVRRLSEHARTSRRRRVSCSYTNPDFGKRLPGFLEAASELCEWSLEIALDVIVKGLQRRDVEKMDAVGKRRLHPFDYQRVELPKKCSECLSCACGSKNQRVAAARNRRPAHSLWL